MSIQRKFNPTEDGTDDWKLFKTVKKNISQAKKLNTVDHFCQQTASQLILAGGTDYASSKVLDASETIAGDEIVIKPEKRTTQMASTLEALEIIQNECGLPEALVLRSQLLILQRFNIVSNSKSEKEDMIPCIREICLENDEMNDIIWFIRFNTFIMLIFTILNYLVPLLSENKKIHNSIDIEKRSDQKPKNLLKPTMVGIISAIELAILSTPKYVYESLVCS